MSTSSHFRLTLTGYYMVRCVVINGEKLEDTFVNSSLVGIQIYYMDEGQLEGTTAYICLVASLIDQDHLGAITGNI